MQRHDGLCLVALEPGVFGGRLRLSDGWPCAWYSRPGLTRSHDPVVLNFSVANVTSLKRYSCVGAAGRIQRLFMLLIEDLEEAPTADLHQVTELGTNDHTTGGSC